MKKIAYLIFTVLHLFALKTFGQIQDNAELQKMYDEDQSAREATNINGAALSEQDSLREARVFELIKEDKIVTGKDYYNSAMIFQHGKDTIASGMAIKQMKKALNLDTTINRWLLAAAIDRDLMRKHKPQIYGTQYIKRGANSKWERYTIDTTQVTDSERRYYHVETLAEQEIKEHHMNLLPIDAFYNMSKSIYKTIDFIKTEKKKKGKSEYDVSENAINSFGYELMNANKNQKALKIFKLNTELYPSGYNSFDSYGECLLNLNKREEALKAYKKSLELNPKNENARKILEGKE